MRNFATTTSKPMLRPLSTLPQCALTIVLWSATSQWVRGKVASGLTGGSVVMIERRCSLSKRVQSSEQCCNKHHVLTGRLMSIHIWHCRLLTFCTLLDNVLLISVSRGKRLGSLNARWNLFGRNVLLYVCGLTFGASGAGAC